MQHDEYFWYKTEIAKSDNHWDLDVFSTTIGLQRAPHLAPVLITTVKTLRGSREESRKRNVHGGRQHAVLETFPDGRDLLRYTEECYCIRLVKETKILFPSRVVLSVLQSLSPVSQQI